MAGTRIVCPNCAACLKSGKTLPAGKQVTCVKCKERFAFDPERTASWTEETHNEFAFSLAETQAGTLKSPMAGMTPLVPADAAPAADAPASIAGIKPGHYARIRNDRRQFAVLVTFALTMLVLLPAAGLGLVFFLYRMNSEPADAQGFAEVKQPSGPEQAPAAVAKDELPKKAILGEQPRKKDVQLAKVTKKIAPASVPSPVKADEDLPRKIDESTRKGVAFLTQSIKPNGTWKDDTGIHSIGYAALPALAMLECGVAAQEPAIQQAAAFVRARAEHLKETYDLGTTILFLDRLGDPKDKKLIQTLALRLMAGQTPGGGWTYECPILNGTEELKLMAFLESHKPEVKLLIPLQVTAGDADPAARERDRGKELAKSEIKLTRGAVPMEPDKAPAKKPAPAPVALPPRLRDLPVVAHQTKKLGQLERSADDNSNTHFAMLGLWAARRHQVPVESSLALVTERFQKTQAKDGGWGYVVNSPPKNTMTCVGLMGLAMGHGSAAELFAEAAVKNQAPAKTLAKDPAILDALTALGMYLDGDKSLRGLEVRIDLYYLWCLERVGMLYGQKEFGKKDWFLYGAKLILENQQTDGRWQIHYDSPIDTAFALLFLNRSDLVNDLTAALPSYLDLPRVTGDDLPRERARPKDQPRERERPMDLPKERERPMERERPVGPPNSKM